MLKRIVKSIVSFLFSLVVATAANLVLVPLYLVRWSATVYGEWVALSSCVGYLSSLDLGMNSAAMNSLAAAHATGEMVRYRKVQASAMLFYILMAATFSVAVAFVDIALPLPALLGVKRITGSMAKTVLCLLAFQILWQMPAAQIYMIFRSTGDLAKSVWVENVQKLTVFTLTAVTVSMGASVGKVALVQLVPTALIAFAVWQYLRRREPELLPRLRQADAKTMKELIRPSLLFGLVMLGMALSLYGPVMVVSALAGGAVVALLVTTRTLANAIRQLVGLLCNSFWPELTRMGATGVSERLRHSLDLLMAAACILSSTLCGFLYFDGQEVMALWTRGRIAPDVVLLRVFLVALLFQTPWLVCSTVTAATNRHGNLAISYVVTGVVSVGLTVLLFRRFGLVAVPLSAMCTEAFTCYHFVVRDACRLTGQPYGPYAVRLWRYLPCLAAGVYCAGFAAHAWTPGPLWVRWTAVGCSCSVLAMAATWCLWLTHLDKYALTQMFSTRRFARGEAVIVT